jgi:hypothetical protein
MRSPLNSHALPRCLGALTATLLLVGCGDSLAPTAVRSDPSRPEASSLVVAARTSALALDAGDLDLSGEFRFVAPLTDDAGDPSEFDASLTGVLTVTVCQMTAGGCGQLAALNADGSGPQQLRLGDDANYIVVWKPSDAARGSPIKIAVSIGGLVLGSIERKAGNGAIPIKFSVDRHPVIRVRSLREQGRSSSDVAQQLVSEFALDEEGVAQLLLTDVAPYSVVEVGTALREKLGSTDERVVAIYFGLGVSAADAYRTVTEVFEATVERSAEVLDKAGYPLDQIASVLGCSVQLTARRFTEIFQIKTTKQLAPVLKEQCKASPKEAAAHLKSIGKAATEVVDAEKEIYGLDEKQAASALKDAGYTAKEASKAEKEVYNLDELKSASALKDAGYTAKETGGALKETFGSTAEKVATIFAEIDVSADETFSTLTDEFGVVRDESAALLHKVGYKLGEVAKAAQYTAEEFVLFTNAFALEIDFQVQAIVEVLWIEFGQSAPNVAAFLVSTHHTVNEVAGAIRDVFSLDALGTAAALKAGGYSATDIGSALRSKFLLTAAAFAAVFRAIGEGVSVAAEALQAEFGLAAENIATLLRNAGYDPNGIASVLRDRFNWTAVQVAALLKDVFGLSQDDIESALGQAGYTANQVRAAIEGFFGQVGNIFCGIFGC